MQKDVIYIDVEDDITSIIGKVKDAKEKVIALVPPKRIGVLQSAVNLRLLMRAADQNGKRVVLITNNQALVALASSAKLPVAKNLQSKPEVPDIPALKVDDDDDIIDGEQLPVGDHADAAATAAGVPDAAVDDIDIEDDTPKKAVSPTAGGRLARPRIKNGVKVPSFNSFRKKILFIGGGAVLLIIFLVWAIFFAPRATVVITAQTSPQQVKTAVTLGADVKTDASQGTLKSTTMQDKEAVSVDFNATGKQDVGEKASGTVTFSTDSISNLGKTVPVGTQLTSSSGLVYTTTQSATFTTGNFGGITVGITSVDIGDQYNGATGAMSGAPSKVSAQVATSPAGGSKKTITVVSQQDVMTAKDQLSQKNTDDVKKKLAAKFPANTVVIDSSFIASAEDPTSGPEIGKEATDGKAKLTQNVTYSITGVDKNDLDTFLTAALKKTLSSKQDQRVYDTGVSSAQITAFTQPDGAQTATATLSATGQVGPMINDNDIKERVKGKRFGEIQSDLRTIDGINDAVTKFSPFWVQTVPNDSNKITIKFELKNGK